MALGCRGRGAVHTGSDILKMSALPPKADIAEHHSDVRFVPKADILHCSEERPYSITSSARSRIPVGRSTPIALAVFRLTTNSNLAACSTGRSEGFDPRNTLET